MNCSTPNTIRITGNSARIVFIATAGRCSKARILRTTGWTPRSTTLADTKSPKRAGDEGKFAVPSLRNVALTAPYMHDGRFRTLEEVVEHYCTGMKRSATLDPNLAKHPDGGVPLSADDKRALVAFLKTLTDEKYLRPAPPVVLAVK